LSLGHDSFYKINENKSKRKINIDLAVVASQIPRGVIHDKEDTPRIVELGDDRLDLVSDIEGLTDPYMDL